MAEEGSGEKTKRQNFTKNSKGQEFVERHDRQRRKGIELLLLLLSHSLRVDKFCPFYTKKLYNYIAIYNINGRMVTLKKSIKKSHVN